MAEFYGRLQGNRGEATRCGSKDSGIRATVESWQTVIRTSHHQMWGGERRVMIGVETKYGSTLIPTIVFDADALAKHHDDPEVGYAVQAIVDGFDKLDEALKSAPDRVEVES